jgi:hypothetical protein
VSPQRCARSRALGRALLLGSALLAIASCGKSKTSGTASAGTGPEDEGDGEGAIGAMDEREAAQWAEARQGEPEELMRLVNLVGCSGLRERAVSRELRPTAIFAMKYCPDFSELPWLVALAAGKDDVEARAALDSIGELAARPRRGTDPEDADELHAGCQALLVLARSISEPKPRRVRAVRALRMLSERGCVRRDDIPKDVDAK